MTKAETLKVAGASLYYQVRGSGPVLLMMPGGPATGSIFQAVASYLETHYTVVTYDPRGLGKSKIEGSIDDGRLVESFVDDVHQLVAKVSEEPVFVFSNSAGAIIGLEFAARHPEQIRTLVAHEPPRFGPREAPREDREDLHDVYRSKGVKAAMHKFMVEAGLGEPSPEMLGSTEADSDFHFFLGHYIVGLAMHRTNTGALRRPGCRIVPAVGADSGGEMANLGGLGLARILGVDAEIFPGGHGGFMTHPAEFAAKLSEVLGH